MLDLLFLLKALGIGLATGLFSGLFGVGGGVLSIPLLRMFLSVNPHVAVGTTLAVIVPTAISAALNYSRENLTLPRLALVSGLPALVTTVAASIISEWIPGSVLMLALSVLMVLVGIDFLLDLGNRLKQAGGTELPPEVTLIGRPLVLAIFTGMVVGLLSGFLGIGGGFVLIPAYCYLFRLPVKVAFGTSLLVVAGVAVPGALVHYTEGHVEIPLALSLLGGSLPGAWLGSRLAARARESHLKSAFGVILLGLAGLFAFGELRLAF